LCLPPFCRTIYAPRYVKTDISFVTHPKTINSSWGLLPLICIESESISLTFCSADGLLLNFTVGLHRGQQPVDRCDLWDKLMTSLHHSNG
jgi:hypothetical protein